MKIKFNYVWLSFLVIFLTMQLVAGQNIKNEEVFFRFPKNNFLTVKMIQNRSPVQFENIDVYFDKTGRMPILNWGLRNNSAKTVKRFVVAFKIETNINKWSGITGHTEYDINTDEKNDLILPQTSYEEMKNVKSSLLQKNELQNMFTFNKDWGDDMYVIIYGMIKKVVFEDGSIYEENDKIFKGI